MLKIYKKISVTTYVCRKDRFSHTTFNYKVEKRAFFLTTHFQLLYITKVNQKYSTKKLSYDVGNITFLHSV